MPVPIPRCPKCGQLMRIPDHAIINPTTSPWLCDECHLGFWDAELTPKARQAYRPAHNDFGFSESFNINSDAYAQVDQALRRGTSVTEELLPHLTLDQVTLLSTRNLEKGFAQTVTVHLATRKAGAKP